MNLKHFIAPAQRDALNTVQQRTREAEQSIRELEHQLPLVPDPLTRQALTTLSTSVARLLSAQKTALEAAFGRTNDDD